MATNPIAQKRQVLPIGRRSASRARVFLPATLEAIDSFRNARVLNLSSSGAMVETARPPMVGKELIFKCYGIDVLATVVWVDGDHCGIEFYDAIEEDEVIRQRELSESEFARQKWQTRREMLDAAERWSMGRNA